MSPAPDVRSQAEFRRHLGQWMVYMAVVVFIPTVVAVGVFEHVARKNSEKALIASLSAQRQVSDAREAANAVIARGQLYDAWARYDSARTNCELIVKLGEQSNQNTRLNNEILGQSLQQFTDEAIQQARPNDPAGQKQLRDYRTRITRIANRVRQFGNPDCDKVARPPSRPRLKDPNS